MGARVWCFAATYEEVWALMHVLIASQQETDRKFQESDHRFQETERLLKEQSQETNRRFQETERLLKQQSQDTDRKIKEVSTQIGKLDCVRNFKGWTQ